MRPIGSGVNGAEHPDWSSACKLHCITDKIHQHYKRVMSHGINFMVC